MDPATVFLAYIVGVLCIWLLGTIVHPAIEAVSRVGVQLRIGRQIAALVVSVVLIGGVASAGASVGPPSRRLVQMVEAVPSVDQTIAEIVHRPTLVTVGGSIDTTYTVVSGDSLWRIARTILSTRDSDTDGTTISELWRSIYDMNRDLIGSDPNLIHPGQVLQLPGR